MAKVLVLDDALVRELLNPAELLAALEAALRALSAGQASVPPRVAAVTPFGLVAAMPGYVPGAGAVVKLVTVFPENATRGLPTHQAVIGLFDVEDGRLLALVDGTSITALRTAATAALAAKLLARAGSRVLAVLGAGVQGAAHLEAFTNTFEFNEIRVASRDRRHADALASHHARATVATSFESAVRGADVVCCCTDSPEPVISYAWLSPGAHVGSVGFGAELDGATVEAGAVFVEWRGAVTSPSPAGAAELQGRDPLSVTELGEVLNSSRPGRTSAEQLTVYKSTGHAAEDVAAATLVYRRALEAGVGATVEL